MFVLKRFPALPPFVHAAYILRVSVDLDLKHLHTGRGKAFAPSSSLSTLLGVALGVLGEAASTADTQQLNKSKNNGGNAQGKSDSR